MSSNAMKSYLDRPHIFYETTILNGPLKGVNFPVDVLFHWALVELRRKLITFKNLNSKTIIKSDSANVLLADEESLTNVYKIKEDCIVEEIIDKLSINLTISTAPEVIYCISPKSSISEEDMDYINDTQLLDNNHKDNFNSLAQISIYDIFTKYELEIIEKMISLYLEAYPVLKLSVNEQINNINNEHFIDYILEKDKIQFILKNILNILQFCNNKPINYSMDNINTNTCNEECVYISDSYDFEYCINSNNKKNSLYLIGYLKLDKSTILHELSHALYYTNQEYYNKIDLLWNSLERDIQIIITKHILLIGYNKQHILDEWQAYLIESPLEFGKKIKSIMNPLHNELQKYIKFPNLKELIY